MRASAVWSIARFKASASDSETAASVEDQLAEPSQSSVTVRLAIGKVSPINSFTVAAQLKPKQGPSTTVGAVSSMIVVVCVSDEELPHASVAVKTLTIE